MTVAINSAPSSERGAVMGTFTAFFDLSFGGGSLALGVIARAIGYNGLFGVATAVASLGLFQILFIPPKVPPPTSTTSHRVFEIQPPGE
jgi:predicted MFS family arabinose efflux permease